MFNVTVLRMKDIIRYIIMIIIAIILIISISKMFTLIKKDEKDLEKEKQEEKKSFGSFIKCLDKTIPAISIIDEESNKEENKTQKNYLEEFLKTEISSIKGMEEAEKKEQEKIDKNEENKKEEENKEQVIQLANTEKVQTEVVTPNPIAEKFNVQYGNVKIKNGTSYTLTEDMLKPDITIENKNVLIFHTHSCESYTSSEKYQYIPTGNYRTTDLNFSVTRVGTELENYLKQYNINTIHDKSYHDYPAYNGSYTRSLATVEGILKNTPSDIVIDLHRDAIGSREDYAPTVKIGEDYCAQIMFVIRNK